MSDGTPPRIDSDPAARVANDLRVRLRAMEPEALVALAAELLNTYVVEGVLPLARAGEGADLAQDSVGEESFAMMIKRLKAAKKDPLLERFLIDGENITVRIDGYGMLPLTEYRRPTAPPAAGGQASAAPAPRGERVPGASTSIYNRSLYAPDPTAVVPAPARTAPAAPDNIPLRPEAPGTSAKPAPAGAPGKPAPGAAPGKKDDQGNDRFSLIELE